MDNQKAKTTREKEKAKSDLKSKLESMLSAGALLMTFIDEALEDSEVRQEVYKMVDPATVAVEVSGRDGIRKIVLSDKNDETKRTIEKIHGLEKEKES